MLNALPAVCSRAREWSSLRVDGELSELERAHLAAHLRRCPACAEFDACVQETTRMLRHTPLDLVGCQIRLPARVRVRPAMVRVAVAAIVALGVGGALVDGSSRDLAWTIPRVGGNDRAEQQQFRTFRAEQLREGTATVAPSIPVRSFGPAL
jgi:predicted anti-sigma-YlaC factor YlaD